MINCSIQICRNTPTNSEIFSYLHSSHTNQKKYIRSVFQAGNLFLFTQLAFKKIWKRILMRQCLPIQIALNKISFEEFIILYEAMSSYSARSQQNEFRLTHLAPNKNEFRTVFLASNLFLLHSSCSAKFRRVHNSL